MKVFPSQRYSSSEMLQHPWIRVRLRNREGRREGGSKKREEGGNEDEGREREREESKREREEVKD